MKEHPLVTTGKLLDAEEWWTLLPGHYQIDGGCSLLDIHLPYDQHKLVMEVRATYQQTRRRDSWVHVLHLRVDLVDSNPVNVMNSTTISTGIPHRVYRSRNPRKIVEKIRNIFCTYTNLVDEDIIKREKRLRMEQNVLERRQEIVGKFQASIEHSTTNAHDSVLAFRMTKNYELIFTYEADSGKPVVFTTLEIGGNFTQEEVQQLINWLATCPSAVADRILEGKPK